MYEVLRYSTLRDCIANMAWVDHGPSDPHGLMPDIEVLARCSETATIQYNTITLRINDRVASAAFSHCTDHCGAWQNLKHTRNLVIINERPTEKVDHVDMSERNKYAMTMPTENLNTLKGLLKWLPENCSHSFQ